MFKSVWFVSFLALANCQDIVPSGRTSLETGGHCSSELLWSCNDGQCISLARLCDNSKDCSQGEDEKKIMCLTRECNELRGFLCADGLCIGRSLVCDGSPNCFNGEDEKDCNEGACPTGKFDCGNGYCIPNAWTCDVTRDCPNGEDEKNCKPQKCPADFYQCDTDHCKHISTLCDEIPDCHDGLDERNCVWKTCSPSHGKYLCEDKKHCISAEHVCDGKDDCVSGTDEGGLCARDCSNSGCIHNCYQTPVGPQCYCNEGFGLTTTGKCKDIDECAFDAEVCDHSCTNTQGSYECSCADGYELKGNTTCRVSGRMSSPARLHYIVDQDILYREIGGSRSDKLVSDKVLIHSTAYDPVEKMLYWTRGFTEVARKNVNENRQSRSSWDSPKDASGKKLDIVVSGLKKITDIEMDWLGRNLYVLDSEASTILACNVERGDCAIVTDSIIKPKTMELDLEMRYMFLGGSESGDIVRTSLDGTGKQILLPKQEFTMTAMTLYPPAKKIFWYSQSLSAIMSMDYERKVVKSLKNIVKTSPTSIAVWEGKLYWSESVKDEDDQLMSFTKVHGSEINHLFKTALHSIEGIFVYHDSMFQKAKNPCENNLCSHICLLSTNEAEFTCACPVEMKLAPNQLICIGYSSSFVLTTHTEDDETYLKKITERVHGPQKISPFKDHKFVKISDTYFDFISSKLYVSEIGTGNIHSYHHPSGGFQTVFKGLERPGAVAVDSVRNNLYWINSRRKSVHVYRMDGKYKKQLLNHVISPIDLTLDPQNATLFVCTAFSSAAIWRADLNGENSREIINKEISQPTSITIDPVLTNKYVYWTDAATQRLERCNYDGGKREAILTSIPTPLAVAVSSLNIYVMTGENVLGTVNKKNFQDISELVTEMNSVHMIHREEYSSLSVIESIDTEMPQVCIENDGCDQFCFSDDPHIPQCGCEDKKTLEGLFACEVNPCPVAERACADGKCIDEALWCDGSEDCSDGFDEKNCSRECSKDEFRCDDGECIPISLECLDGFPECKDGSDAKKHCPNDCSEGEWRCQSQDCIGKDLVCNKRKDCPDGSDEEGCEDVICSEDQISCMGSRICVDRKMICDGSDDCPQGDDEKHCSCRLGQFACDDKDTCIEEFQVCDGVFDCPDKSDEGPKHPCSIPTPKAHEQCGVDKKSCDFDGKECIGEHKWCDGSKDCKNGTDEMECQKCSNSMVHCRTTVGCLNMEWVCDGVSDCADKSDEENCHTRNTDFPVSVCQRDKFPCDNQTCIPWSMTCDGKKDCESGADEAEICDPCKNGDGCKHFCISGPEGARCACKHGFRLNEDGKTCDKIVDCRKQRFYCDHICNLNGTCQCAAGYSLHEDRTACSVTAKDGRPAAAIVWRGESLKYYSPDQKLTQQTKIPPGVRNIQLEHDGARNEIYVLDKKSKQMRVHKDGHWLLVKAKINPIAFAVDSYNQNLYVAEKLEVPNNTNFNYSSVKACSMKNFRCVSIVSSIQGLVNSMAVSSESGYLVYCLNYENSGEIHRVSLEGDNKKVWISKKSTNCESLAIHPFTKSVLWIDSHRKIIQVIDKLGGDRASIETPQAVESSSLFVVGNHVLYQNNPPLGYITECSLKTQVCSERDYKAILVGSFNPSYEKEVVSKCDDLKCDHVCIETMNVGHCKCSPGYKTKGTKCILDPSSQSSPEQCPESMCSNGHCVIIDAKFECRCPEGFTGPKCETEEHSGSTAVTVILIIVLVGILGFAVGYWANNKYNIAQRITDRQLIGVRYSRDTGLITHEGGTDTELNSSA